MTAAPAEPITTPAAPAAPPVPSEPSTAVTTPPVPAAPAEPPKPADPAPTSNPWDDPAAAKAEIEKLRRENGSARTTAKAQAAEEARKELAASLNKILDPDAAPVDPATLAQNLTASQQEAKQARVALAVYQNAGTVGDPLALLDSTTFLASVAAIDPTDTAAVQAAIAAAVAANPRLGAAPTDPRAPQPNPAQGASGGGAPDLDAQIVAAQQAGNTRLAIHLQNQKLTPQRGA